MDRRTFLRRGLLGGALLAGGASGLLLWPSRLGSGPRRPLKVLSPREFAILTAVAARTVTVPGADAAELAHRIDDMFVRAAPEATAEFKQLLLLFENALAGLVFDGRIRPFTRLSPEAQDDVLRSWRDSRVLVRRGGYQVLRKLTLAAYYAAPESWVQVGYPGPPQISAVAVTPTVGTP